MSFVNLQLFLDFILTIENDAYFKRISFKTILLFLFNRGMLYVLLKQNIPSIFYLLNIPYSE